MKKLLYLFLFIIVVGMIILYQHNKIRNLRSQVETIEYEADVLRGVTVEYKNANGQMATQILEYQKNISDLGKSYSDMVDQVDSVEMKIKKVIEASKLRERQIEEALYIAMNSKGSGVVYTDPETSIKIIDDGFLNCTINDTNYTYSYQEEIFILDASVMRDRKFFLWRWIGWKKLTDKGMVEIVTTNPNNKIKSRKVKLR
jgi:hypothetical protein